MRQRQTINRNTTEISKKFIGINFPFGNEQQMFDLSVTTEEQTISNLKVLLITSIGERYHNPNFGTRLKEMLFENKSTDIYNRIKEEISSAISYWLPQIKIEKLIVTDADNSISDGNINNTLVANLYFRVTEQGANQEIIIFINGFGNLDVQST